MKNKLNFPGLSVALCVLCASAFNPAEAQTNTPPPAVVASNTIPSQLTEAISVLTNLPVGAVVVLPGGQSFQFATNATGGVTGVTSTGPSGSVTVTAFSNPGQVEQTVAGYIAANNPADASFYSTNDLIANVGVSYLQNSGNTIAEIDVGKYGLMGSLPLGVYAGLLQGAVNGSQSTAGGLGGIDYRKVIGSAAGHVGIAGGYDAWSKQPFAMARAGVELRQNQHLGEYAGVSYTGEASTTAHNSLTGLWLDAHITYAF